jgi:hypothetical protein
MTSLATLDLRGNSISTLSVLPPLGGLTQVDLDVNQLLLAANSAASNVVTTLQNRGVTVSAAYQFVNPNGSPVLALQLSNRVSELSWPDVYLAYNLQSSTNLTATNAWANVPITPFPTNSELLVVTNFPESTRFFRLTAPVVPQ